jgi:hypothetical protein
MLFQKGQLGLTVGALDIVEKDAVFAGCAVKGLHGCFAPSVGG